MKYKLVSMLLTFLCFFVILSPNVYAESSNTNELKVSLITNASTKIVGKAEAEQLVSVYSSGTLLGEAKANQGGSYQITIPKQKAGTKLKVIATNEETGDKKEVHAYVYSTNLTVEKFTAWQTKLNGKAGQNITVQVRDGKKLVATSKTKSSTKFSLTIPEQKQGKKLTVTTVSAEGEKIVSKNITVGNPPVIGSGKVIGKYKSQIVEILRDYGNGVYRIKTNSGKYLNVTRSQLYIPADPKTVTKKLTKAELELVANKKITSKTNYAIWLDISRQMTYVFKKDSNKKWKVEKSFLSATGKNVTPTVRGTYKINYAKWGFYASKTSKVHHATNFYGAYYFHSVILNLKGQIIDNTLGKRASHGCVRLAEKNALYISKLPVGTTVWIP